MLWPLPWVMLLDMFVDTATVVVKAGKGGDGAVSFRREKFVDKGATDGGDGGKGGDVVFVADRNLNTLANFRHNQELKAESGAAGTKQQKAGKSGKDLRVKVPIGTIVQRDDIILADLTQDGQTFIVANGGKGGFGNAHFKSSTRQAPRVAELGEKGESFEVKLELKLLADVGLVGFPNAGKSTFLSTVSNARPEIADYEFTTLSPNLGVADIDDSSLLIADIPGLIEGASKGKGLGDEFLRHIERTAVLLHLIDAYKEDPAEAYQTIRQELAAYSGELAKRPEVVVITKTEGLDKELITHQLSSLQKVVPAKTPLFAISSQAHIGLQEVLRELKGLVKKAHAKEKKSKKSEDLSVIQLNQAAKDKAWQVKFQQGSFRVTGNKIEGFAARTDFSNPHSVNRLRDIMRKMGIVHELERQGADGSSKIIIGDSSHITLVEQ